MPEFFEALSLDLLEEAFWELFDSEDFGLEFEEFFCEVVELPHAARMSANAATEAPTR